MFSIKGGVENLTFEAKAKKKQFSRLLKKITQLHFQSNLKRKYRKSKLKNFSLAKFL